MSNYTGISEECVPPAWVGPQVNKFEQISSDDHKMSLAGGGYVGGGYIQGGIPTI